MKIESKVLIYSMINNLIISIAKIAGGLILGLSSLLADGLHTFCDFATDIICMIGTKISKHRPTKKYPFGRTFLQKCQFCPTKNRFFAKWVLTE